MATKRRPVDIAIVGLGWTGGIIAQQLAETGLRIVAFERGPDRSAAFRDAAGQDELQYGIRNELMQDTARETLTFRNHAGQTALPMRQLGSFLIGEGVGGAGVTWNGITLRWSEWDHAPRSAILAEHGAAAGIPSDMTVADWGVTYQELEPYYDRFEQTCATSGKAGNLRGRRIDGGNIFEGPRSNEYPLPPLEPAHSMILFEQAARTLGYHPFPQPASNASRAHTTPDGISFGACRYCGFCDRFSCQVNAKASPHFTVIPLAFRNPGFEVRARCQVLKVNLDSTGRRATGVTYRDAEGNEIEQPAELVILSAYGLGNVHLMLLSGIGRPYDPVANTGVVGRNYAYQVSAGAALFFDENTYLHPFMGAGALGTVIDDFNAGNFDAAKAGFIGGGVIFNRQTGGRPIAYHPTPSGTPAWGSAWKRAVKDSYERATAIVAPGSVMPYRQNYLDLDPTYTDAFGRPLLRMTFDFQPNEVRLANHQADRAVEIGRAMGAARVERMIAPMPYSIIPYQTTHNTGGSIMGADPATSAVNRYLQVWDVPNVFVAGASVLPQNAGRAPTPPVAALAYWAAEAIRDTYLKQPGPLVPA